MKPLHCHFIRVLPALALAALFAAGVRAEDLSPEEPSAVSPGNSRARQVDVLPSPGAVPDEAEEPSIRLNFRSAPLETVLSHISEAAGYTIVLESPTRGTLDVWNDHLMTRAEALGVLNAALNKAGLTAIAEGSRGNLLRIVSREDAKKRNLPIKIGAAPANIPKDDTMVTQIMPMSHVSASQLVRDLSPLISPTASITSNEGGNAILITDTQANIRHFAELAKAIDDSMTSLTGLRVIPLRHADAKTTATVLKELYQSDAGATSRSSSGQQGGFGSGPGGFGGGPGGFGGPGNGGMTATPGASASRSTVSPKIVIVAEEHSNSLLITAPEDQLAGIEALVKKLDENVDDLTELRVFPLKNADPAEMVELLSSVFPDESSASNNSNSRNSPFGGSFVGGPGGMSFGGPGGGSSGRTTSGNEASERSKKQGKVSAVADARTASVIVTASQALMRQVETVIAQLDSNTKRRQKVYVVDLKNADPETVQQILQNTFPSQQSNSRSTQNQSTTANALTTRANQNSSQSGTTSSGSGGTASSGLGGSRGGGTGGGF